MDILPYLGNENFSATCYMYSMWPNQDSAGGIAVYDISSGNAVA
jgi:hypothetical protein